MDILINPLCSDFIMGYASDLWLCLKYFPLFKFQSYFKIYLPKNISHYDFFFHFSISYMNDKLITHQKVIYCISEPWPEMLDSDFFFHTLFQLSEVLNTSHLRSVSGTGNAFPAQNALSPWWAGNSSLGRMTSFATNVALPHSSVESCTAALFSL